MSYRCTQPGCGVGCADGYVVVGGKGPPKRCRCNPEPKKPKPLAGAGGH